MTRPMLVTYLRGAPNKSNEYVSDSTDKDPLGGSTDKERRGTLVTRLTRTL